MSSLDSKMICNIPQPKLIDEININASGDQAEMQVKATKNISMKLLLRNFFISSNSTHMKFKFKLITITLSINETNHRLHLTITYFFY